MVDTTHGRLGIVGCMLLEDEIIHVLSNDKSIEGISIIDCPESSSIQSKLINQFPESMISLIGKEDLDSLAPLDGFSVLIWMKPMALHENPERLKKEVIETVMMLDEHCDSILLFYGLCGNAFRKIEEVSNETCSPIIILRDDDDQVVDDCIGAVVGGTQAYLNLLKKYPGVMYMTPMWASCWKEMIVKTGIAPDTSDIECLRTIFQMVGYRKVLKLKTGLGDEKDFEDRVNEFASLFDFEKEEMDACTLDIIERSWTRAKQSLT